eukprot:89725_1
MQSLIATVVGGFIHMLICCKIGGIQNIIRNISNMNGDDINGNIGQNVPVKSTRIRVGRNIHGYGLSPGILKHDKLAVEKLIKVAFKSLKGELAGMYEKTRQQLVDDHI